MTQPGGEPSPAGARGFWFRAHRPPSSPRFFLDIASDSPPSDSVNHSLSFISDGNVLALHRLLWNNQERIGQYLSSNRDHKAVGRRPFDKMATLLAYLGPPEHKPVADTHWSSLNLTSSKFEEFMTRWVSGVSGVWGGVRVHAHAAWPVSGVTFRFAAQASGPREGGVQGLEDPQHLLPGWHLQNGQPGVLLRGPQVGAHGPAGWLQMEGSET